MSWTEQSFVDARETIRELLEELEILDYQFEVEPREGHWEVCIGCGCAQGWHTTTFAVGTETLLGARRYVAARRRLRRQIASHVAECSRHQLSAE